MADPSPLSQDQIKRYGYQLMKAEDLRATCGQGKEFRGNDKTVSDLSLSASLDVQAIRDAAHEAYQSDLYANADEFLHFVNSIKLIASRTSQGIDWADKGKDKTRIAWIEAGLADLRDAEAKYSALEQKYPPKGDDSASAAQMETRRAKLHEAIRTAIDSLQTAESAIACRSSEHQIGYFVGKSKGGGDETTDPVPDTLGDKPFVFEQFRCASLTQVAVNLNEILSGTIDHWSEINLSLLPRDARALIAQVVVDYVRHHGGRKGLLEPNEKARLRRIVLDLLARFTRDGT